MTQATKRHGFASAWGPSRPETARKRPENAVNRRWKDAVAVAPRATSRSGRLLFDPLPFDGESHLRPKLCRFTVGQMQCLELLSPPCAARKPLILPHVSHPSSSEPMAQGQSIRLFSACFQRKSIRRCLRRLAIKFTMVHNGEWSFVRLFHAMSSSLASDSHSKPAYIRLRRRCPV